MQTALTQGIILKSLEDSQVVTNAERATQSCLNTLKYLYKLTDRPTDTHMHARPYQSPDPEECAHQLW